MSRGYFGIGIENSKYEVNLGTLWRSAYNFGADFIFLIGERFQFKGDTTKAWRHIPLLRFPTAHDFIEHIPYNCIPVGVEVNGTPINYFEKHPERAIYILGPEDGSLSAEIQEVCAEIVSIESKYCLNVAIAGSIIMYDRSIKNGAT